MALMSAFDIGLDALLHEQALIRAISGNVNKFLPRNHIDLPAALDHLSMYYNKTFDTVRYSSLLHLGR
jgi:hypothetical protein